jgi:hypothetical protein
MLNQKQNRRNEKRAARAAEIKRDKKIIEEELEKKYNEFIKKNNGWPTATKIQNVKQTQTLIGKVYAEHDKNIRTGLTFKDKKSEQVSDL